MKLLTLSLASLCLLSACATSGTGPSEPAATAAVESFSEDLSRRTFDYFWETTDTERCLAPDRWPSNPFSSIAATGFALTAYGIGAERGYASREEAAERTRDCLEFYWNAPQGPATSGVTGYKGFFYHFLDMETGRRYRDTELSTVDTTLLLGGLLYAAQWFDGDHPDEVEIRRLAQAIYERVEWDWTEVRPNRITMGWKPESGFIRADWHKYNEGMLVLLLAMGSPTHPLPKAVWDEWCSVYDQSWTDEYGPAHLHFAPLFGHQYSHMYVDFRGIHDAFMRAKQAEIPGFDYFQNSVRAVQAQRNYAIRNTHGWTGYSADVWGLTACDGPGDFKQVIDGRERQFFSYSARGPGERDDGTLAPTAALGSMPFAPAEVTACMKAMKARYGAGIYTGYGFLDAFNPTLAATDRALQHGRIVPGVGWVDGDYLGIDQGPIVVQIENHRSDAVWRRMRREPNIVRGLKVAGFTGGWLADA